MGDKLDNPQAFPRTGRTSINGDQDGMTLRDWFAGQLAPAFAIEFAKGAEGVRAAQEGKLQVMTAEAAYMVADAMLAARKDSPHG